MKRYKKLEIFEIKANGNCSCGEEIQLKLDGEELENCYCQSCGNVVFLNYTEYSDEE